MFSIEQRRAPGRPAKYPWRQMQVGDSFFVAGRTSRCICKDASAYRPMRFRTKTVIVNGERGVRVWRTA